MWHGTIAFVIARGQRRPSSVCGELSSGREQIGESGVKGRTICDVEPAKNLDVT